jgi:hypothetical protein
VTLGYTTIVTPIDPKRNDILEDYLRKSVRPLFDPDAIFKCQSSFRFDQINSLHLCSLLILPAGKSSEPAYLVFEVTFDGTRENFLHDLVRVVPDGIHAIYQHCVGYPESGLAVPALIEDYLAKHDAGAQTFFSGSPGRSVTQILGEKRIRDKIVSFVCRRRQQSEAPTTLLDLQRELQQKVIRDRPANRWAEQPAVMPWEVAQRMLVAGAAGLALALAACALGVVVLASVGLGPADVYRIIPSVRDFAGDIGRSLTSLEVVSEIVSIARAMRLPIPLPLISLIIAWAILRLFELVIDLWQEQGDPRNERFLWRYLVQVSVILRYALIFLLIGFGMLSLFISPDPAPPLWFSLVLIAAAVATWLLLQYWSTSLRLLIQFQRLSPDREVVRHFLLEAMHFAMVVVAVWTALIFGVHMPASVTHALGAVAFPVIMFGLVLTIYTLVGALVAYAVGFVFFALVRLLELRDRRRFASATQLITERLDPAVYEREDGGVNKYQNHLASLTYVKPGIARGCLLRLTLLVIGLLSKFWFNQGDLGGIPTILAARWVLIDGGRRLLFLTNYGGGWESYLNEFIDMGAVKGLNCIWSNTFLQAPAGGRRHAFPQTSFYFWRGAQDEQPFKAYVRHSQIETIVWYSAYPTLSVVNLNSNTDLRQALFKPLAPFELDSVFLKAGL